MDTIKYHHKRIVKGDMCETPSGDGDSRLLPWSDISSFTDDRAASGTARTSRDAEPWAAEHHGTHGVCNLEPSTEQHGKDKAMAEMSWYYVSISKSMTLTKRIRIKVPLRTVNYRHAYLCQWTLSCTQCLLAWCGGSGNGRGGISYMPIRGVLGIFTVHIYLPMACYGCERCSRSISNITACSNFSDKYAEVQQCVWPAQRKQWLS